MQAWSICNFDLINQPCLGFLPQLALESASVDIRFFGCHNSLCQKLRSTSQEIKKLLSDNALQTVRELVSHSLSYKISVVIPARNEAGTIGGIVSCLVETFQKETSLVDEVIVVDDHSTDLTAQVALDNGGQVFDAREVLSEIPGPGKGQAMYKGLHVASGDIVVFIDGDIIDFDPLFVAKLVRPLLLEKAKFTKGTYLRLGDGQGGGRVTELVAKPLLSLYGGKLATFMQPLSGEVAGWSKYFKVLPFVWGYGVDVGLLIDMVRTFGPDSVLEVDLKNRRHVSRALGELVPQAREVLSTILKKLMIDSGDLKSSELSITINECPPLAF